MRLVQVETPFLPGRMTPVAVRDAGRGRAVVILHGGWGWGAYPFDDAIRRLGEDHRVVAPDRTGYGGSGALPAFDLPTGYHRMYAEETLRVLDALGIDRVAVWGHSDGAVVAAWLTIEAPERVRGLLLEGFHHRRAKVGSLPFFRTGATEPEAFGPDMVAALREDHGEPRWREVVGACSRAWLGIIDEGARTGGDLYGGRMREIRCPVLFLHGSRDPRSEPGEIQDALAQVPHGRLALVEAGHAPHASARSGAEANRIAAEFLASLPV